jgi:hypothetical protein
MTVSGHEMARVRFQQQIFKGRVMRRFVNGLAVLAGTLLISSASIAASLDETKCKALAGFSYPDLRVDKVVFLTDATDKAVSLPAHCVLTGFLEERTGTDGKKYATGFELRLPANWNTRFFFQGGGGTDGSIQPALGRNTVGYPPALTLGYAVASTDGGHNHGKRSDTTFGHERKALIDWGYNSIELVALVSKALILDAYGLPPKFSYLVGNSNGGRQGLMAAIRFGNQFDGILAGAPILRQTRGHVATAWSIAVLSRLSPKDELGRPIFAKAYSKGDLLLINNEITRQCDPLDGLKDGIVDSAKACNFDIGGLVCKDEKSINCITQSQADAFVSLHKGPVNSAGEELYVPYRFDAGSDFAGWHLGDSMTWPNRGRKARNTSIFNVFRQPPDPAFDVYKFDFDKDVAPMDTAAQFTDASSSNMDVFKMAGGKLIVYHGTGDSGISAVDTARWFDGVRKRYGEQGVSEFARLYLLAGVQHGRTGPGPHVFPGLDAIVAWVEQGKAPDDLTIRGGKPSRERPMCAYPTYVTWREASKKWVCE